MEDNVKPPDPSERKDFPGSRARPRKFRIGLIYTAVAVVAIAVAVVVVVYLVHSTPGPKPPTGTATLESTGLEPGVGGDATLAQTPPGWRIELNVTGLPAATTSSTTTRLG